MSQAASPVTLRLANCATACFRQTGSRDLIEQRLEQVIVVAIDNGDVEGGARQSFGGREPAESRSDNDDARTPR
jgi:hypothetical protein